MLKESPNLLVMHTDKNLGPAIVNRAMCKKKVYSNYSLDKATYQSLSSGKAHKGVSPLIEKIIRLIVNHHDELLVNHRKFLLESIMTNYRSTTASSC
jgi:hypothetical protein